MYIWINFMPWKCQIYVNEKNCTYGMIPIFILKMLHSSPYMCVYALCVCVCTCNWKEILLNLQKMNSMDFPSMMGHGWFMDNLSNYFSIMVTLWSERLDLISKSITCCIPSGILYFCCFTCKMGIILVSTFCVTAKIKRGNINIQQTA